jgi:hypothetical protein
MLGFQDDLNALILFMFEDIVAVRSIIQAQTVCNDEGRVNLASLNTLKQRA